MSAGERLQRLETLDVSSLSVGAATAALRDLAVVRGTAAQLEGAIARRLGNLHEAGAAAPTTDALTRGGRASRRAAETAQRRAITLGAAPRLNDALGKGKIGTEHADAVASAASRLDDDQRCALLGRDVQLTELAASRSPEKFRRDVARIVDEITADDGLDRAATQVEAATFSSGINAESGMYWFRAELAPEDGNRVRRLIDHEANALAKRTDLRDKRRDQVDAVALVTGARSNASGPPPADVVVLVPYDTLIDSSQNESAGTGRAEYSDGTPMPAATARRHACDANIIPLVLGGDGLPLDVGRARRLATPSQRHALRSMYRTCALDGCDRTFDRCHIHHLLEWDDDGFTDLDNLVPLCSFHHHRAHEGRWRLQLDSSTRQLNVWLPSGPLLSRSFPDVVSERAAA